MSAAERIQVLDLAEGPALPLIDGQGEARAVVWPGMGARLRSIHRISLAAGARTVPQRHSSDAVYYVVAGEGDVTEPAGPAAALTPGAMFHVDAGTEYVVRAVKGPMELVGGPAPADPALYERQH